MTSLVLADLYYLAPDGKAENDAFGWAERDERGGPPDFWKIPE